jgi:hypothetical protein
MTAFLHQIFSGLAMGGIYAILALALMMIYQATQLVNFAQGEMAMFSTYMAWEMIDTGLPYWAAFLLTIVFSFIGGMMIERVVIRRLEKSPVLTIVIVFIGLLLIFNRVAGWHYTYTIRSFDSPFPDNPWFGNVFMSPHESGAIAVAFAVLSLVYGREKKARWHFSPLGLGWSSFSLSAVLTVLSTWVAGTCQKVPPFHPPPKNTLLGNCNAQWDYGRESHVGPVYNDKRLRSVKRGESQKCRKSGHPDQFNS